MSTIKCVHCGADCGKHPVTWDEKAFCCNGCKTVYQLLNENKLYSYYQIDNEPGIRVDNSLIGSKYSYLDNDEIREKLIEFSEGNISKVTFYIPAIHCSSCIWLLENLQTLNKAVVRSMVHFVKKQVTITFDESQISLRQLVELLASIHYIPQVSLEDIADKSQKKSIKPLLYKIGVAGFCFGNTMLFSFPEYLPGKHTIDNAMREFLGILNLLLAFPVVFYSGWDYLVSAFKNLRKGILNIDLPISIGILTIFIESSYSILSHTGTGYMDSLAGLVFFLLIGKWYQAKTYQALSFERDYKSYFPVAVTRLLNKVEENIPLSDLNIGDRLLIRNQELIPADAVLMNGNASIDYSFVSGESRLVNKSIGDQVFAGGKQTGSSIEIEIVKNVEQSQLTQLWNQNQDKNLKQEKLSDTIDKVSKYFTIVILMIAFASAIFWFFMDKTIIVKAFASVLIVACPCALALSIPFTFGNTMRIFGRKGFYLKKTDVIESLAKADTIVFDKTGTLTQNDESEIEFHGPKLSEQELQFIKSVVMHSSHPASRAISNYLNVNETVKPDLFEEKTGQGIFAQFTNNVIKVGSATFVGADKKMDSSQSQRVYVSVNKDVVGYFSLQNKYRFGFDDLVSKLSLNYDLHLISGDNNAEKLKLSKWFSADNLHFEQSPQDKLDYIRKLKKQGRNVLMIGDGLNDAGALSESDVGISMADNIYQFSPACDAILEAGKFHYLYNKLRFTKISMRVVRFSFIISFFYNVIGLGFAVQGLLSPVIAAILMPASSVTVVGFVTLATSLIAKSKLKH